MGLMEPKRNVKPALVDGILRDGPRNAAFEHTKRLSWRLVKGYASGYRVETQTENPDKAIQEKPGPFPCWHIPVFLSRFTEGLGNTGFIG